MEKIFNIAMNQLSPEIQLLILREFNQLDDHLHFFPLVGVSYRNLYTKHAKLARRVCRRWRDLIDLSSSIEFRVTSAVLRRTRKDHPRIPEDGISVFRKDLECKSVLTVFFCSELWNMDDESFQDEDPVFFEEMNRVHLYEDRLISLCGNFMDFPSGERFLDMVEQLKSPSSLIDFDFQLELVEE